LSRTGFSGTTLDNPKNEICKMVEVAKEEEATENEEVVKGQL